LKVCKYSNFIIGGKDIYIAINKKGCQKDVSPPPIFSFLSPGGLEHSSSLRAALVRESKVANHFTLDSTVGKFHFKIAVA